jgi:hypothetical protein
VFTIYYVVNHDMDLPWVQIGSILALFAPLTGISLAVFVEALVLVFDRLASLWRPLGAIANPITAGVVGGALAGIAPGAIGVTVFGGYRGPFVGTWMIAFANITGAVMVAVPLARRARKARRRNDAGFRDPEDSLAIAAATAIATLALCAAAAIVTPLLVDSSFERIRGALEDDGPGVGAIAGAVSGGIIGVYIGLVVALGRRLGRPARTA